MSEIRHDGLKGMKWGRRRYRNYDGTLTEEGRERYGYGSKKESMMLSDDELKRRIDRLSLEKRYRDLVKELDDSPKQEPAKDKAAKRKEFVDFIMDVGKLVGFTTSVINLAQKLRPQTANASPNSGLFKSNSSTGGSSSNKNKSSTAQAVPIHKSSSGKYRFSRATASSKSRPAHKKSK